MNQVQTAVQAGLAYIRSKQAPDGSFGSFSSPTLRPFRCIKPYRTTFVPSLILSALAEVPGADDVCKLLSRWLIGQMGPDGSYNYWAQDAPERQTLPYPDDLDDTFCALIGLQAYDPTLIDGRVLAYTVRLLLATEVAVGGPYRTWLVTADAAAVWQDVDLAVNANIAHFLRQVDEPLPNVVAYIEDAIRGQRLVSPYYPSWYPIAYYIARAYDGPEGQQLVEYIRRHCRSGHWVTPLQTALASTALRRLGYMTDVSDFLLSRQSHDGSWPAEAYCIDPARQGRTYYHGSSTLTTALVIEALSVQLPVATSAKRQDSKLQALQDQIFTLARQQYGALGGELGSTSQSVLGRLEQTADSREIVLLPYLFYRSLSGSVKKDEEFLIRLGLANMYGWLAYTIFDDFLDDEGDPKLLPTATVAMRYSLDNFRLALPDNTAFQQLVAQTFDTVDGANAWEVTHCRFGVEKGNISIGILPTYGQLKHLAGRSLGHALTPMGVLASSGIAPGSKPARAIFRALRHYLIARQLSDDMHDWESDVRAGHISYVVATLMRQLDLKPGTQPLSILLPRMQQQFWQHSLVNLCRVTSRHIATSRRALQQSGLMADDNCIALLLDRLEESVQRTLAEQTKAQDFLAAYTKE